MVSNKEFITPLQEYFPLSPQYISFWKQEKQRCIEGLWVSGKWMPPKLYFYVNYGTIEVTDNKSRKLTRPNLRDIDWDMSYLFIIAKGFSGFELDDTYSCHEALIDPHILKHSSCYNSNGELKQYMLPWEYLTKHRDTPLGLPLYYNDAKNVMIMGSRGAGKSYTVHVGVMLHEWLFNSQLYYDQEKSKSRVVIGAWDSKYVNDATSKIKVAYDQLPGAVKTSTKYFPSPLSQASTGTLNISKTFVASYEKKENNEWITKGTLSTIAPVSFYDNPYAPQGSRNNYVVVEEVGMCPNAEEIHFAAKDTLETNGSKYGSMVYIGTGGAMATGGTLAAYRMFYSPKQYNLVTIEDEWELRGAIPYFIPHYKAIDRFKDEEGNTNTKEALAAVEHKRSQLRGEAYYQEQQNNPIKPSEIFLSDQGSILPTSELKNRLDSIQSSPPPIPHKLIYSPTEPTGILALPDYTLQPITTYPWDKPNREGAVVIYEEPVYEEGKIPQGLYIIGYDPFRTDSSTGPSLGAIYVLKTSKYMGKYGNSKIVAAYIGRPYLGRDVVNEICLKLAMYYNAKVYFENEVGNTKEFFEKRKKLQLLAKQPTTVLNKKASYETSTTVYGYPMSNRQVKEEAILYLRSWLLTPVDDTKYNLDFIEDKVLLQQLVMFSFEGNFDAVLAFAGCIIGLNETVNELREVLVNHKKLDLSFLTNNKSIFKDVTKATLTTQT